jgi:hypothetical protein
VFMVLWVFRCASMVVLPAGQSQNWWIDLFIASDLSMALVRKSGLEGGRRGFLA